MKKRLINKKKNQKGFTLVELIVVVAIIGVLVAMMVPSIMGYVNKAKSHKNSANARTIASTVQALNAPLDIPIVKSIKYESGAWKYSNGDAFSTKTETDFEKDLLQMVTVDGNAYVKIESSGKVSKVIYSIKAKGLVTTGSTSDDSIGVWGE